MPMENERGGASKGLSRKGMESGAQCGGIRARLLENYLLIYILNLVAAYSFLVLFFISLFIFGKVNFVSEAFLAIFVGAVVIAALPWVEFGRRDAARSARRVFSFQRSPRLARIEIVVAAVLWGAIALVVAVVVLGLRISRG